MSCINSKDMELKNISSCNTCIVCRLPDNISEKSNYLCGCKHYFCEPCNITYTQLFKKCPNNCKTIGIIEPTEPEIRRYYNSDQMDPFRFEDTRGTMFVTQCNWLTITIPDDIELITENFITRYIHDSLTMEIHQMNDNRNISYFRILKFVLLCFFVSFCIFLPQFLINLSIYKIVKIKDKIVCDLFN